MEGTRTILSPETMRMVTKLYRKSLRALGKGHHSVPGGSFRSRSQCPSMCFFFVKNTQVRILSWSPFLVDLTGPSLKVAFLAARHMYTRVPPFAYCEMLSLRSGPRLTCLPRGSVAMHVLGARFKHALYHALVCCLLFAKGSLLEFLDCVLFCVGLCDYGLW